MKKLNQKGFGLVEGLVIVIILTLLLGVGSPVISANIWKSATLEVSNSAVDAINKASAAVKEFDAKTDASSADFDNLISAYKDERDAIETALEKAKSVGGFKGLDLTGNYNKASQASGKLTAIYDELLNFNTGELASAEAEKQIIVAFEQGGGASDATGLSQQASNVRVANKDYQKYLASPQATEIERKFSTILAKLADALDSTAQAINSNNLAQIDAADAQLQAVLAELDALEPGRAAQIAARQQQVESIVDKLNTTTKELE